MNHRAHDRHETPAFEARTLALATLAAAQGDFAAAAEMQYDAWMAASPAAKPAIKRALDVYESKTKDAAK